MMEARVWLEGGYELMMEAWMVTRGLPLIDT
jgi:hypothetical protein